MSKTTNTSANTEPNEKLRGTPSMAELDMRDYFAAKASEEDIKAQAEVIRSSSTLGILPDGWRVVARYMHADAMLAARGQSNDGCGACGDGCRERGSCRVKDESPELPINDGWIEWKGGECPVHKDTVVQVKLRENSKGTSPACHYRWSKFNSYGDIVAYRVVQEGGAV